MSSAPCEDDAKLTGPIGLFCGRETYSWSMQDFLAMANFAKSHGVTTLFIKVAEVTDFTLSGWWYGGLTGWDAIYQKIQPMINVIPYIFPYGLYHLDTEISIASQLLTKYGKLCLDMEGSTWTGQAGADNAAKLASALAPIPGKVWLSHMADFAVNNQAGFMAEMVRCTNVFMPMAYDDYLVGQWQPELMIANKVACVQPTLDLSQEFGGNTVLANVQAVKAAGCLAISLWYEKFAQDDPGLLDKIVQMFTGTAPPVVPPEGGKVITNKQGMVLDIVKSFQLEPGESEDLCGIWAPASLKYAGLPGKGARGSAEDIDVWTDNEADRYLPNGHVTWLGAQVSDVHNVLADATDPVGGHRNLHFWDIPSDVATIRIAVRAGYPVLITANEQNIISKKTGQRAYPWNLDTNHILPVAGLDHDGDFICPDELNNSFQGEWPCIYLASRINPSWATVVQVVGPDPAHPWLKPIPSGDPKSWPSNFNAQLFAGGANTMLPNGAQDNGKDTITFANGKVMKGGFRRKYLEMAASGLIPADDQPLENEYPCHPVEKSNPDYWQTEQAKPGAAQETRYFRFGYSPARGVKLCYMGQEFVWLKQQPAVSGIPQVVLDDLIALASHITPAVTVFDKLVKDAGLTIPNK